MPRLSPFSEKAMDFIEAEPSEQAFMNLLEGAIRSGKTWAMIPKLKQLCRYDVGGERVITGVSKDTVYHNILKDLFEFAGRSRYTYNRQTGDMTLWGARWRVVGAKDEGSEKYIRGATVGVAYCDEATLMPESFLKMLLGRMSPEGARLYGTTNPDSPFHYLKRDYLDKPELRSSGYLWSQHFTMDDNLSLTPEVRARYEAMYAGVFYLRFIKGLWVVAEGAIYGGAWSDRTLYDDASRPVGLYGAGGYADHLIFVDYGTKNPCVFIDAIDDGKTLWLDREYYWDSRKEMRQKTDAEYADDLERFIAESRVTSKARVVIDPSAASFAAELQKRGIWVLDANNEVPDGIRRTATALKIGVLRVRKGTAVPGPFQDGCPNTEREMQAYAWNEKKAKIGEEEPIKANDHSCDAIRYGVNEVFSAPWRLMAA